MTFSLEDRGQEGADSLELILFPERPTEGVLSGDRLGMFGAEATYQTSAASLLNRLNRGLFRRAIEARFLTTFYGMLRSDGALMYSNGGHNAPILVARDGIRRLEAGGIVLGLFEDASYD